MKVILNKDIAKTGRKYDVIEVKSGYATNYLFPRGLAKQADKNSLAELESLRANAEKLRLEREKELQALLSTVNEVTIPLTKKANDKGHLFASVSVEEIAQAIKDSTGVQIESDHIVLKGHVKEVGEHKINIKVGEKGAICILAVTAE